MRPAEIRLMLYAVIAGVFLIRHFILWRAQPIRTHVWPGVWWILFGVGGLWLLGSGLE